MLCDSGVVLLFGILCWDITQFLSVECSSVSGVTELNLKMVLFQFSARSRQDGTFTIYGKRTDVGIVQSPSRRLDTIITRVIQ
jgi:hypothetical protein